MRKLLPLLLGLIGLIGGFVTGWALVFIVYLSTHAAGPLGLAYDRAYAYGTVSGVVLGLISGTVAAILGKRGYRG